MDPVYTNSELTLSQVNTQNYSAKARACRTQAFGTCLHRYQTQTSRGHNRCRRYAPNGRGATLCQLQSTAETNARIHANLLSSVAERRSQYGCIWGAHTQFSLTCAPRKRADFCKHLGAHQPLACQSFSSELPLDEKLRTAFSCSS